MHKRDHGIYCPPGHSGDDCEPHVEVHEAPKSNGTKGDDGKNKNTGHGNVKHHGHGSGDHGKKDDDGLWDGDGEKEEPYYMRPVETEEERRKRLLEEERLRKEREEQRLLDAHREMLRARMLKDQQN